MTEKITNIMIPDTGMKVDIEKMVIWGLRKHDYVYKYVKVGDDLVVNMVFHFVPINETPISYDSVISEFDTEETPMKSDKEPEYKGTLDKYYKTTKTIKAPNNTMLFKHWVNENKIKQFTLQSFIAANVTITKEQAEKIVTHQIQKKTIRQIDTNMFKIVKEL